MILQNDTVFPDHLAQKIENAGKDHISYFLDRLVPGFTPLGFNLFDFDASNRSFEFRKPDNPLRFIVCYCEGGAVLFWTELEEYDLLSKKLGYLLRNMPAGVKSASFENRNRFWKVVNDVVAGVDVVLSGWN